MSDNPVFKDFIGEQEDPGAMGSGFSDWVPEREVVPPPVTEEKPEPFTTEIPKKTPVIKPATNR